MLVIPAVDLHGGKCVRLLRGERDKETVYSPNPVEVALKWQSQGAKLLHVVDLDGAFAGKPVNSAVIKKIASSLEIPVQLGGGIRDRTTVENVLNLGVSRVILGTVAVEKPDLVRELAASYGEKIVVGIDVRDGIAAVKGWVEGSDKKAVDLALEMQHYGVKEIIYTDISRDGTLKGPNMEALKAMADALEVPVIASGGVSSLQDLHALKEIKHLGISGVIVGQALYTEKFTLNEALLAVKGG
ncbi:MAG: 1-(5-phosphoribosyl)-5-[(5-phosphoribosylamino)methylideneamino]imidazole-4-carboxamide isomerase [Firmicutes bacterium]|nr:1-(5-phosphoribosyl)-5-[(5-phosphoribosylamino)methylideneamino]imidazole-4-carboxamide isomerase [Bacillota bacterium]